MTTRPLLAALGLALGLASLSAQAIGQRADVTIVDRTTGRELPVYWHEGRAYVAGKPGNEYSVSVRNQRGQDVLAIVSVDGVNVMDGRTADAQQSGYVLSGWQRYDILGWRKSLEQTAAFYFTTIGGSYAGRTGRPENVGVIGVALFDRKQRYVPMPAQVAPAPYDSRRDSASQDSVRENAPESRREKSMADAGSGAANEMAKRAAPASSVASPASPAASAPVPQPSEPLGTGHGRREDSQVTMTAFDRASRHPVETIAIYYDSYRNLVAQGVIPTYGRRDPQPFPHGFTPDP